MTAMYGPEKLHQLMSESDFVVVATPLTDGDQFFKTVAGLAALGEHGTRNLIDAKAISVRVP